MGNISAYDTLLAAPVDGVSSFKSTVFCRSASQPSTPEGGSYSRPLPDGDLWSDGIPGGEAILWASTRIFTSDGKSPQQGVWSTPRQMTDTSDFDVAYYDGASYGGKLPTTHHASNQGNGWKNAATTNSIWMATDRKKNGTWQGWQVAKIKGEKGEGVSIISTLVKYASSTSGTTQPSADSWMATVPPVENGNYLWTWTQVTYSDGTVTDTYGVSRMGVDGKGIKSSVVSYSQKETQVDPGTISDWSTSYPSSLNEGWWLYVKTVITYSEGDPTTSYSVSQVGTGAYYAGLQEYYAAGVSGTVEPANAPFPGSSTGDFKQYDKDETVNISTPWRNTRPQLTAAVPYLWNFSISFDSAGNKFVTKPICIGNFAKGIQSIVETYAISAYSTAGVNGYPTDITSWTDEQHDTAPTDARPYQWNKTETTYNNGTKDTWYHISAVKGGKGDTGQSVFKSTVFKRSNTAQSSRPTGGSYTSPVPTVGGWSDGIPDGEDILWASTRIFTSDGASPQQSEWSVPKQMTDTSDFDIAYYDGESYGGKLPTTHHAPVQGNGWKNAATTSTIWMATDRKKNGTWEGWQVSRIKGEQGYQGDSGEDGNGIVQQISLFLATNKDSGVVYSSTGGWSTVFQPPTEQLPYVWKCVRTIYSQIDPAYSVPELVAVYQHGANPNLLDNASFVSDDNLDKWTTKSYYSILQGVSGVVAESGKVNTAGKVSGRNSFYDTCRYTLASINYKEVLGQTVHKYNGDIKKLVGGKWYTFSFWAKGYQQTISIEQASSLYGFAKKELYLQAGRTYKISVRGYIDSQASADGKTLRTYVYNKDSNGNWIQNNCISIAATSYVTKTMAFTPSTTGTYYLMSFMYDSSSPRTGEVYVSWYKIEDSQDLMTYVYPSAVDTSASMFVDGVEKVSTSVSQTPSDLAVCWKLGTEWSFHRVSFKTKASLSSAEARVLFRLLPTQNAEAYRNLYLCMPKLETGMMATGFIDTREDIVGGRGPALRGPQDWKDCGIGFAFMQGKIGEPFFDVVDYNGFQYVCNKSHTKTATNYPGSDEDERNSLWTLGDKIALIAAKLVLAQYGVIKNLGAEGILMKDADGNTVFRAERGEVECNKGIFNNVSIRSGKTGGQRIELNPDSKSISVFDADGNECTAIDGDKLTMEQVMPDVDEDSFTLAAIASSATLGRGGTVGPNDTNTLQYELSASAVHSSKPVSIKIAYSSVKAAISLNNVQSDNTVLMKAAYCTLSLVVNTYSDSACSKLVAAKTFAQVSVSGFPGERFYRSIADAEVSVLVNSGYHKIYAKIVGEGSNINSDATFSGFWLVSSAVIVADFYKSKYFANGFVLARNIQNYFAIVEENGIMNFAAASNGRKVQMMNGSLTIDGAKQPIVAYAARVTDTSESTSAEANPTSITVFSQIATGVTIKHTTTQGRYRINIPQTFSLTAATTFVRVVGYGNVAGSSSSFAKATVGSISVGSLGSATIYIDVSDDSTRNYGGFYVEVLKYL